MQCLGGTRYKVTDMPVPVTVNLPANFRGEFNKLGAATLEDYRSDLDQTGVTVFENAVPVRNDASWTRDPAAGTTAHSMATWLSQRPFLTNTTLTATTVGGRQAWLVTGDLKSGVPLLSVKDGNAAAPTFSGDNATAAYSPFTERRVHAGRRARRRRHGHLVVGPGTDEGQPRREPGLRPGPVLRLTVSKPTPD